MVVFSDKAFKLFTADLWALADQIMTDPDFDCYWYEDARVGKKLTSQFQKESKRLAEHYGMIYKGGAK